MYSYLTYSDLISSNQPGLKHSDSCINQTHWIAHQIYHSLDIGLEVRGEFLDILKAFDGET